MRRIRSVIAVACLVLSVLIAGVWVRGYFVSETVGYGIARPGGTMSAVGFTSGRGGVGFALVKGMPYQAEIDGPFWQPESYDHWVRDADELERIVTYIAANPVKAGLVKQAQDWFFCSAHDRYLADGELCGWLRWE